MIQQIQRNDLPVCLTVIRKSFATVAEEFGITEQNCPTNPAFMQLENIQYEYEKGSFMFGYYKNDEIVGFMKLTKKDEETFDLGRLAVLPAYRHNQIGQMFIEFARDKVRSLGGKKIAIGIIEENIKLKEWYAKQGFIHKGTQLYAHLPFTVGNMEMEIKQIQ